MCVIFVEIRSDDATQMCMFWFDNPDKDLPKTMSITTTTVSGDVAPVSIFNETEVGHHS